jgi:hypothetical protein
MKLIDYLDIVKSKINTKKVNNSIFLGLLADYASADIEALNELNIVKASSKTINVLEELQTNYSSTTIESIIKKMQKDGIVEENIILVISLYLAFINKKYDLSKHFAKVQKSVNNNPKAQKSVNTNPKAQKSVNTNPKAQKSVNTNPKSAKSGTRGLIKVIKTKNTPIVKNKSKQIVSPNNFVTVFNIINIAFMMVVIYLSTLNIISLDIMTNLFYLQVVLSSLFMLDQIYRAGLYFGFTLATNGLIIITQLVMLIGFLNLGFIPVTIDLLILSILAVSIYYYSNKSKKGSSEIHFLFSLGFISAFLIYLVVKGFYSSNANLIVIALVATQLTMFINHQTSIQQNISMVILGYIGLIILIAGMSLGFNYELVYSIVYIILVKLVVSYLYSIFKLQQLNIRDTLTFIILLSIFSFVIILNLYGIVINSSDLLSFGTIYGIALLALFIIRNYKNENIPMNKDHSIIIKINANAYSLGSHTAMVLSISSLSALLLQILTWAGIVLAVLIGLSIIITIVITIFNR